MNNEKQTPLTLLDACTLLARETVSLLEGFDQIPDSAVRLRSALALVNSEQDLGDGGALLGWVDAEMENTKHFAETGEQAESLVKLKTPFAMPAPAMQMDAACILLKAAAQRHPTLEQWQTMGSSRPSVWLTSNTVAIRKRVAFSLRFSVSGLPSGPYSVCPVSGSLFSYSTR